MAQTDFTTLFEMSQDSWDTLPPETNFAASLARPAGDLGGYVLDVPPHTGTAELGHILRAARARGIGWLYPAPACRHSNGTHAGSCTYAALPEYWDALVAALEEVNADL